MKLLIFFIYVLLIQGLVFAQDSSEFRFDELTSIEMSESLLNINITSKVGYREKVSKSGPPATEDLVGLKKFKEEIKLGYTNDFHGLFFKIKSGINKPISSPLVLTFNHSLSGVIEVYRRESSSNAWEFVGRTGSQVPFHERLVKGFELAIPLKVGSEGHASYFLRRKSMHRFDARVNLELEKDFEQRQGELKSYYFFYMGAFIALILYNLFLYFSSKERNYLYYFLFGLAIHLTVLAMTGFIDYLLAPFNITGSHRLILFSSSSLVTALVFAYSYNNIAAYCRNCIKVFIIVGIGSSYVFLASLGPWNSFFGGARLGILIDILIPFGIIFMMFSAYLALRRGHVLARFYLISWAFMFGGALIYFSHFAGFVPRNFFSTHAVMWGNLFEMLIVSLGLAYKISTLDREKKEAFIMAKGKREYERLVRVLLHDIGNPVSLINYYTKLRQKDFKRFKEREEKAWEKITFGVEKIDEIIKFHRQQELNLSQNFRELDIDSVNLREALIPVKEMFEESLYDKGVTLEVDLDKDLYVKAERVSLVNEVLNNIVSNSIKFSYEGGSIHISAFEEVGLVYLKLKDEGKGISEEDIKSFMEDKGITSKMGTKGERGTGYGLYLVKSYMDLYGGQLLVQSTSIEADHRNHGTVVTLIFNKAEKKD